MKLRGHFRLPGPVVLLVAALAFQLSKGLRMVRVDHADENWTLAAINSSFDKIVIFVLEEDNHPPSITSLPRLGPFWLVYRFRSCGCSPTASPCWRLPVSWCSTRATG
jgi:hypothetical protein